MSLTPPSDLTRESLLQLLRDGPVTAPGLARELGISGTAVRKHIDQLRLEGLVEEVGVHRGRGRPAILYGLTGAGEAHFKRDRADLLEAMLAAIHAVPESARARRLLRDAGGRLARWMMAEEEARRGVPRGLDPVDRALHLLHELGGRDTVRRAEDGVEIFGFVCPLAEYVEPYPETCQFVAGFTEEVLGRSVTPGCIRGAEERKPDTPLCILRADAA